jgi:hypothetical protein
MALGSRGVNRIQWLGLMIALFSLSIWVVTQKNSVGNNQVGFTQQEAQNYDPQLRIDRERKIEVDIEELDRKFENVKTELRHSPVLSKRRRELRSLQRALHAQRRLIRQQLHELRRASSQDWEHLADHLDSEIEKAKNLID